MSKGLSHEAQRLADALSDTFWDILGYDNFCLGCEAPGELCPACDDPFSSECCRSANASNIKACIEDFAKILSKAVGV